MLTILYNKVFLLINKNNKQFLLERPRNALFLTVYNKNDISLYLDLVKANFYKQMFDK